MGYININGQASVFVQTGMKNASQAASAQLLSKTLGGVNTGYINNGTEGLVGDVGEYLPNSVSKKDVLNEYTYRTLNAQGPTLIVMHSAGNEDAKKALQVGAMYGHTYDNLSFVSLGSPVGNNVMQQSVTGAGANYLGQVSDWKDPVTYSKTATTVTVGSFLAGAGTGAVYVATYGATLLPVLGPFAPAVVLAGGAVGGAVGGLVPAAVGLTAMKYSHPFEKYIAKPQTQSMMLDWLKHNPQRK
jgi:filamentous hemagglutinin